MSDDDPNLFLLSNKKYEINEMLDVAVGKWASNAYSTIISLFMYTALLSYSTVVASSLVTLVPFPGITTEIYCNVYASQIEPSCLLSYNLYLVIFFLLVLPIAFLEISEQKILQIALTIFRFVTIFIIVITTLIALFAMPYGSLFIDSKPYSSFTDSFVPSGIPIIYATIVFAQLCHHSVPGVIQPIKNKHRIRWVFPFALFTTFLMYALVGLITSAYFGTNAFPMINLNWITYTGAGFNGQNIPVYARIISAVVVLFPIIDIVSAYPLNSVTLSSNLYSALPASVRMRDSKLIKIALRLVASIPPIILSSFIRDLGVIVQISSVFGFFITFFAPAILQLATKKKCLKEFGRHSTIYSFKFLDYDFISYIILALGIISPIVQVIVIILERLGILK
ncbi:transmembrane protein 104 homolog isoform X2 [Schistocerca gregaria]|nr:transmembrane protein 104 homolog isoform X2 [Schistocerca gregaria]